MNTLSLPQMEALTYSEINELALNLQKQVAGLQQQLASARKLSMAQSTQLVRDLATERSIATNGDLNDGIYQGLALAVAALEEETR